MDKMIIKLNDQNEARILIAEIIGYYIFEHARGGNNSANNSLVIILSKGNEQFYYAEDKALRKDVKKLDSLFIPASSNNSKPAINNIF